MKKMIVSLSMALLVAGAMMAQDRPARTPEERAKAQTARMTQQLGLDADQQAKVASINMEYAQKQQDLQVTRKEGDEKVKGEGMKLHEARMAAMKAVLTPEQYTKLEAMEEKMKERVQDKRKEQKEQKVQKVQGAQPVK